MASTISRAFGAAGAAVLAIGTTLAPVGHPRADEP